MDFAKILSDLNIDPKLILINIIGFGVLYLLVNKLVFTPIGRVLDDREGEISSTYDKLDADQKQMEALKSEYETRLEQIEAEAREKIQAAIKEAEAARDKIIADANVRAKDLVTKAEGEAEREREQAMITLRQQIVDLAMGATHKVVGESLDAAKQKSLIDDFITSNVAPAVGA
jgi:F-type H+-transporting ATPase subunit b